MFEEIINASKGKQIIMFLDYDGTLSPIVDDPDKAFMTAEVCLPFYQLSLNLTNEVLVNIFFYSY